MAAIMTTLLGALLAPFKPRTRLVLENLVLRQQLAVLRRTAPRRVRLRTADRLLFVWLYRLWPEVLEAMVIVRPETVLRWHRDGF
jgi:putative transposase